MSLDELARLRGECAQQVLATGLNCPLPLLKTKKALATMRDGERVYLAATDPGSLRDLSAFAAEAGHAMLFAACVEGVFHFVFEKHGARTLQARGKVTPV